MIEEIPLPEEAFSVGIPVPLRKFRERRERRVIGIIQRLDFGEDLFPEIDIRNCMEKRTSEGGASSASAVKQLKELEI